MLMDFYFLCVDFMIAFANLAGVTYRDSNIIILLGLIPVILTVDVIIIFRLSRHATISDMWYDKIIQRR